MTCCSDTIDCCTSSTIVAEAKYSVSLTEKFALIPSKCLISYANFIISSLQYLTLSLVISVMYLNLMPLFLRLSSNFLYSSTSIVSERALESPQELIVFALDKNCNIVFITFSEPYTTSVFSGTLMREENVKDDK